MQPDVPTYYQQTAFDYRVVWGARQNLAVHFGYYDEHARHHLAALDNLNRALAGFAGIAPGMRILDAGCGRGSACFWLAGHCECTVTGINISPHQLAVCQREQMRRQMRGVSFVEADYCATPFPDGAFDVVWACESLCHAARKGDFYREAFRLLKPGGRVVAAEYVRTGRPLDAACESLLHAWLRPWAIPDLDTAAEHAIHARTAGFAGFQVKDVTPQVRVSLRNLYRMSRRWFPLGRILHFLKLIGAVRLNNARASIRQYEALEKGAWTYVFLSAEKPH